jgi:Ni,Fe-hydrogenase I large subunit
MNAADGHLTSKGASGSQPAYDYRLCITLRPAAERGMQVQIDSSRPLFAARLFEGKTPEHALAMLPTLFNVCGRAHQAAAAGAFDSLLNAELADTNRHRTRRRAVLTESLREHLLRLYLDWPQLMGAALDFDAIGHINHVCAAQMQPEPHAQAAAVLRELIEHRALTMPASEFRRIDSGQALLRWARRSEGAPARFINWLSQHDALEPRAMPAPLVALDAVSLTHYLDAENWAAFVARPRWEDQCRETGPFARQAEHPMIRDLEARRGGGLMTRYAARLLDVADATHELLDCDHERPWGCAHAGLAMVEASRGTLVHRVVLDAHGRISRYRILAPTEWNFHPEGAAVRLLEAIPCTPETDVSLLARLAVHAVDPCVGFDLRLHGVTRSEPVHA